MKNLLFSIMSLGLLASATAHADTANVHNEQVTVSLSSTQMTRFVVRGSKIVSVRAMQPSEGAQMLVQNDADTGEVFIGFDGDAQGQTYSAYFSTDDGSTYLVILKPDDGIARNIELIPEIKKASTPSRVPGGKAVAGYSEAIVAFQKNLYSGESSDTVACKDSVAPGQQTPNYMVYEVRTCRADGVSGFVLQLMNTSNVPQTLTADQFMQKRVLSVGVSQETVNPGESARVYIEREAGE